MTFVVEMGSSKNTEDPESRREAERAAAAKREWLRQRSIQRHGSVERADKTGTGATTDDVALFQNSSVGLFAPPASPNGIWENVFSPCSPVSMSVMKIIQKLIQRFA